MMNTVAHRAQMHAPHVCTACHKPCDNKRPAQPTWAGVLWFCQVATVQSLSGTGSLRLGAEFIARYMPGAKVLLSSPTWGQEPTHPHALN